MSVSVYETILLSLSFTFLIYLTRSWDKEIEQKKLVSCNLVFQNKNTRYMIKIIFMSENLEVARYARSLVTRLYTICVGVCFFLMLTRNIIFISRVSKNLVVGHEFGPCYSHYIFFFKHISVASIFSVWDVFIQHSLPYYETVLYYFLCS